MYVCIPSFLPSSIPCRLRLSILLVNTTHACLFYQCKWAPTVGRLMDLAWSSCFSSFFFLVFAFVGVGSSHGLALAGMKRSMEIDVGGHLTRLRIFRDWRSPFYIPPLPFYNHPPPSPYYTHFLCFDPPVLLRLPFSEAGGADRFYPRCVVMSM